MPDTSRISTKPILIPVLQIYLYLPFHHVAFGEELGLYSQCLKQLIPLQDSNQMASLPTCLESAWWRHLKCHFSLRRDALSPPPPVRKCIWGILQVLSLICATDGNRVRLQFPFPYEPWAIGLCGLAWGSHQACIKVKLPCVSASSTLP